jgi:hypothetical protein
MWKILVATNTIYSFLPEVNTGWKTINESDLLFDQWAASQGVKETKQIKSRVAVIDGSESFNSLAQEADALIFMANSLSEISALQDMIKNYDAEILEARGVSDNIIIDFLENLYGDIPKTVNLVTSSLPYKSIVNDSDPYHFWQAVDQALSRLTLITEKEPAACYKMPAGTTLREFTGAIHSSFPKKCHSGTGHHVGSNEKINFKADDVLISDLIILFKLA